MKNRPKLVQHSVGSIICFMLMSTISGFAGGLLAGTTNEFFAQWNGLIAWSIQFVAIGFGFLGIHFRARTV